MAIGRRALQSIACLVVSLYLIGGGRKVALDGVNQAVKAWRPGGAVGVTALNAVGIDKAAGHAIALRRRPLSGQIHSSRVLYAVVSTSNSTWNPLLSRVDNGEPVDVLFSHHEARDVVLPR